MDIHTEANIGKIKAKTEFRQRTATRLFARIAILFDGGVFETTHTERYGSTHIGEHINSYTRIKPQLKGRALGRGLSILIDILNPEVIVIGSIYQRAEHLLAPSAQEEIRRNALWRSAEVCRIVPAKLADGIGDYAAIALIAET